MAVAPPVITPAGLEPAFDLQSYYPMLIYAVVIIGMACSIVAATHIPFIKPWKVTQTKLMTYESGMDPIGSARMPFDIKFYLIAITFLIFDVELLFLYPWAVSAFGPGSQAWSLTFGSAAFLGMLVFLVLLTLGYIYEWRKGMFQWR